MKICTVVGARPQFVKAAAVSRAFRGHDNLEEVLVHTGQHFDSNMSEIFFAELDIPEPRFNLGIGGGRQGAMTGRQLEALEELLLRERPDLVLVYGDTNSTLAGALAAVKLHIPIAHVEAGLRSFNRRMPEEHNRVVTDHLSDLLFAPSETAMTNLQREGLPEARLRRVGDVMYDATLFYRDRARAPQAFAELGIEQGEFVLATVHRAENVDDPERLRAIMTGLAASGRPVVLPLHPRTRHCLTQHKIELDASIYPIDPVGYLEMVWLETRAAVIATDSGGIQKEACFLRRPCVTLRDETEWVETVEQGWNVLAGANARLIAEHIASPPLLPSAEPPYGIGNAASLIAKEIAERRS